MLPSTADLLFLTVEQRDLADNAAGLTKVEELYTKVEANVSFPPTPHACPCHRPPPALLTVLRLTCHRHRRTPAAISSMSSAKK